MQSNSVIALTGALVCALVTHADAQTSTDRSDRASVKQAQGRQVRKQPISRPDLAEAEKQVISLTSAFRQSEKLGAVKADTELAKAARYFADFMARTDQYGHNADGSAPAERARKFGYEYCIVSENIAYQYSTADFGTEQLAQRFFAGWRDSPGHRKNMLDPNVTDTAVAIAHSANTGHYFAVQLFGRPRSAAIRFSVANAAGVSVDYSVNDQVFPLPARATRTHQVCRPPVVTLRGDRVEPRNGQSLIISADDGALRLKAN